MEVGKRGSHQTGHCKEATQKPHCPRDCNWRGTWQCCSDETVWWTEVELVWGLKGQSCWEVVDCCCLTSINCFRQSSLQSCLPHSFSPISLALTVICILTLLSNQNEEYSQSCLSLPLPRDHSYLDTAGEPAPSDVASTPQRTGQCYQHRNRPCPNRN